MGNERETGREVSAGRAGGGETTRHIGREKGRHIKKKMTI